MFVGSLLLDSTTAWAELGADIPSPADFFSPAHRAAFRACLWLKEQGDVCGFPTVAWALERLGWIEQVDKLTDGTEEWLFGLTERVYTAIGVSGHAKVITEYGNKRREIEELQRQARGVFSTIAGGWLHADRRGEMPA